MSGESVEDIAVRPWRLAAYVLPVTLCTSLSLNMGEPVSDWPIARTAGEYLLQGHFDVYADQPGAQMGPLALMLAALVPGTGYVLIVSALFAVFLIAAAKGSRLTRSGDRSFLLAAMLLAFPWAALGVQGHADDALVLTGLAAMLYGHRHARTALVVAAFLVAIAAKPTAAVFVPLLLLYSRKAFGAGLLGALGVWVPFVLADPMGFLAAGEGQSDVLEGSLLALAGIEPYSGYPSWVRPIQFVACLSAVWWLAAHRGWAAAIAGALALRTLLEPATWNYYSASVIAGALLFDLARAHRVPVLSLAGFLTFVLSFTYFDPLPSSLGWLRAGALVGILAAVAWPTTRQEHEAEPMLQTKRNAADATEACAAEPSR